MKTIETQVFTYSELSPNAQGKARQWYRESHDNDYWHDDIIDDAKTIGALMGIDIDKVYFTGFCSQGDGACFAGTFRQVPDAVAKVKDFAPNDARLHAIALSLQAPADTDTVESGKLVHRCPHYCHSRTMNFCEETAYYTETPASDDTLETLRDFADWIYSALQAEWNYLNSDDAVSENIIDNEYTFTRDGRRFG